MKNFSLKALGAFIFAAGLVVAGIAAPAQAIGSSVSIQAPVPTFNSNTAAPAFTIVVDNAGNAIPGVSGVEISVPSWSNKAGCPTDASSSTTLSDCGVLSVTGDNALTGVNVRAFFGTLIVKWTGGSTNTLTINLDQGAFQVGGTTGNLALTARVQGSPLTTILTVAAPAATVTFNGNGSTSGSTANQTSATSAALRANGFSRLGYTFDGWSTTLNGPRVYADQASYNFATSTTLYARWTQIPLIPQGGGSSATASLSLGATTGGLVAGSSVSVTASGLQSTAAYTVTVQSTPQTIGSGNAVSGAVSTNVTLPSGLEAGWHTLTFTSTASNGSTVESKYYFKVSASGTLLSTSSTIPAELANTGINSATGISLLAGGLSLSLVGAEMFMIARRKRSN